jgi:hypothetical protein
MVGSKLWRMGFLALSGHLIFRMTLTHTQILHGIDDGRYWWVRNRWRGRYHMRSRTHYVQGAGTRVTLVPFHVAAHAESFSAPYVRALELFLFGVRVAVNFET